MYLEKKYFDYQGLFTDISLPANICNMSDEGSDEEYSSSNDYTKYIENICLDI